MRGLTDAKRGRKPKDPTRTEMACHRAEVGKLGEKLDIANELIEAQGKVWALPGRCPAGAPNRTRFMITLEERVEPI